MEQSPPEVLTDLVLRPRERWNLRQSEVSAREFVERDCQMGLVLKGLLVGVLKVVL